MGTTLASEPTMKPVVPASEHLEACLQFFVFLDERFTKSLVLLDGGEVKRWQGARYTGKLSSVAFDLGLRDPATCFDVRVTGKWARRLLLKHWYGLHQVAAALGTPPPAIPTHYGDLNASLDQQKQADIVYAKRSAETVRTLLPRLLQPNSLDDAALRAMGRC